MDTPTYNVLEITESGVKLVVGYVYRETVYILHALESTSAHLSKGQINDKEKMSMAIKEVVNSASQSLKTNIKDIILVIPPLGLSISAEEGHTNTVSKDGIVKPFDISNAVSIMLKKIDVKNHTIIDVVPYDYGYDENIHTRFFKDEVYSNSITMNADVYLSDKDYYNTFVDVVKKAGLSVQRCLAAPMALVCLLSSYKLPDRFLFLDLGAGLTTFGLAGSGRLLKCQVLNFGSEDITVALMNKLKVSYERADYLKKVFGLTENPDIEFAFDEGFKVADIRETIEESLTTLIDFMREYVVKFEIPEFYPVIITGGGASLSGIESFITAKFQTSVSLYTPEFFGARNKSYSNLTAALKYLSIYSDCLKDGNRKDFTMTRVIDLKKKDEDEIL